jgi:hypothetical protein
MHQLSNAVAVNHSVCHDTLIANSLLFILALYNQALSALRQHLGDLYMSHDLFTSFPARSLPL